MKNFHSEKVTLSKPDQTEMRDRRDNGRIRLENGLERNGHAKPVDMQSQGSYAMHTMHQDDANDYDIDDGVYFNESDLVDGIGNRLSPYHARLRIATALEDKRLSEDATVKTNCVRQNYPQGYHIDIPVYRVVTSTDEHGQSGEFFELASGDDWVVSDSREVTRWYDSERSQLNSNIPESGADMAKVTRMTKFHGRSRDDWKKSTTSGICITRLVVDHFQWCENRLDSSLRKTWQEISNQLHQSLEIAHPVYDGKNLAEEYDVEVMFFRDRLDEALSELKVLDDPNCTRTKARNAWDKVFDVTFFANQTEPTKESKGVSSSAFVVTTNDTAKRSEGDRFG